MTDHCDDQHSAGPGNLQKSPVPLGSGPRRKQVSSPLLYSPCLKYLRGCEAPKRERQDDNMGTLQRRQSGHLGIDPECDLDRQILLDPDQNSTSTRFSAR